MHDQVITEEQKQLFPLLKEFSSKFGMVGGTAVALQIGHRRSIDYDLFTNKGFSSKSIREQIRQNFNISEVFVDRPGELTVLANQVKLTFYKYPFDIVFSEKFQSIIQLPNLLTLASMKAFALGRRAKWKDYVDLYFIFQKHSLKEIANKAKELFAGEFSEKLFREQLAYFEDIDYSETIDYLPGFEIADEKIKEMLTEIGLKER